jgi:hypothetical protein
MSAAGHQPRHLQQQCWQHQQQQVRTAVTAWLQHCLLLAVRTEEVLLLLVLRALLLLQVLPLRVLLLLLVPLLQQVQQQVAPLQCHPEMKCPGPG